MTSRPEIVELLIEADPCSGGPDDWCRHDGQPFTDAERRLMWKASVEDIEEVQRILDERIAGHSEAARLYGEQEADKRRLAELMKRYSRDLTLEEIIPLMTPDEVAETRQITVRMAARQPFFAALEAKEADAGRRPQLKVVR